MKRLRFALLLSVMISAEFCNAVEKRNTSSNLQYLASVKKNRVERSVSEQFDEMDYYISINSAIWQSAEQDCKGQLGPDAGLLSIESEEEQQGLDVFLESQGFGITYWTSGLYDPGYDVFRWTNGAEFPPWAKWEPGHPVKNTLVRVALSHRNRYKSSWRTYPATRPERYICEVPSLTAPVPCYKTNDLVILLDSSGSIGESNYIDAKDFVARLAAAFVVHPASRLSFIVYSSGVQTIIPLTNNYSPSEIETRIKSTPYQAGGTDTALGIDESVDELIFNDRGVTQNLVVITDGESQNPQETIEAARNATEFGIRTFAVGITTNINYQELEAIANYDSSSIFTAATWDVLMEILRPCSLRVCPTS